VTGFHDSYLSAANLPRQRQEVLVEDNLSEVPICLNPSIAAQRHCIDDVLYGLRAIVMALRDSGLVTINEEFTDAIVETSMIGVPE
jgi:type I restriction enzyme R subunit